MAVWAQQDPWSARPATVTIGDSVRVVASFTVPEGTSARLGDFTLGPDAALLVPPSAVVSGTSVTVAFTVALFETGRRRVATPPVELIGPGGEVFTRRGSQVGVEVASVIPNDSLAPALKPGFDPIPRDIRRAEPLVFLQLAVVFAAFLWWKWRSREPVAILRSDPPVANVRAPLGDWAAAGEVSAVAEVARRRLLTLLASRHDEITESSTTAEVLAALENGSNDLPYREIKELFSGLDRAAFAPTHGLEVSQLAGQADDLIADLEPDEETGVAT